VAAQRHSLLPTSVPVQVDAGRDPVVEVLAESWAGLLTDASDRSGR
jgi:hypothetical protein